MFTVMAIAAAGPFLLSAVLTYLVRGGSRRVGFIDQPGGHKQHTRTLAMGGGIAIIVAIVVPIMAGTLLARSLQGQLLPEWLPGALAIHLDGIASKSSAVLGILGCAVFLSILGLWDDKRPLGPWPKLLAQVAVAAFTTIFLGIRVMELLPIPFSILATILWILVITNAFNFLDNMDGLSVGVAIIAAAIFAVAAMRAGQVFVPALAWVMVGSLLGFLIFNFPPATIIMGDAGSLPVGYLMSVLTILTTYYDPDHGLTPWGLLTPFVVLAVPLYDICSVVTVRLRAGDSPFRGDNRHFSHRLVKKGLSRRGAVLTIYLATAATALPAIHLPQLDWTGAAITLLQCLCVVTMIAILEHQPKRGTEN